MNPWIRVGGEVLHYQIEDIPGPRNDAVLTCWYPQTMCSPIPARPRIEQWPSDKGWRVAGQRVGHPSANAAARAYLREQLA